MRVHVFTGFVLVTAAGFVASAVALAQAPVAGAPSTVPSTPDGSTSTSTPNPTPTAIDAGAPSDAAPLADASAPDADNAIESVTAIRPPPPPPPTDVPDASYTPTNEGFSIGLRGGYSIPTGTAGVLRLTDVVTGVVPIGVDVGYFLNPHLYIGGYFFYGFALGIGNNIPDCTTYTCSATMLRLGVVAHYHFRPDTTWDPWVGGGLGYDILNTEEDDDTEGVIQQSGSAHGFDLTVETGIDYKPITYVGLGPYVELASGHYSSDISATSLHEWLTFGIRLRTNL